MRKINQSDLKYLARKAWSALEDAAKVREAKLLKEHTEHLAKFIRDHKDLMYVELNAIGMPVVGMPPTVRKRLDLLSKANSLRFSSERYSICTLDSVYVRYTDEVHAWLNPQVAKLNSVIEGLRFNDTSEGLQAINDFIASLTQPKAVKTPVAKEPAVKKVRKATSKKPLIKLI